MKWKARGLKWEEGYLKIPCEYTRMDEKKIYTIEVKDSRIKNKRSLNANAYAWVLIEKLSKATGESRNEIYRAAIKEVGVCNVLLVEAEHVESFIRRFTNMGEGWLAIPCGASPREPNKEVIRVYYGSSVYSTTEMARLIEYLVMECKQQDIETMNERDLE